MVGVGELKQLNGCAVFDDERDAHAVAGAVRRNQNFPAYQLGRKVTHLKSKHVALAGPTRESVRPLRTASIRRHTRCFCVQQ